MVKVSIVMPVYNGYNFLEKSIESVAKQTLKDVELICIDDGSTDKSLELLNKLSEKYGFIKILTQKNQGSGIARNNGIKNSTGEYVAFLDADDEFLDADALERMYNASSINNADMISANLQFINENDEIVDNIFYNNKDYLFISKEDVISPSAYGLPLSFYKNIFKRSFLLEYDIHFPDLKRGQDPPFLAKAIVSTSEIPVIPVDLYGHHFQSGGGAESKVNSYPKRHDYITHYKLTYDILEKKGYFDLVNRYKKKLFIYLNNNFDNDFELTGFKIVNDVFGSGNEYFEGFEDEISQFRIKQITDYLSSSDDYDFFIKAKKLILEYRIWNNKLLSTPLLKKCFLILTANSLDDYKNRESKVNEKINNDDSRKKSSDKGSAILSKYITGRIDIKNFGDKTNSVEVIENSDMDATVAQPKWFTNEKGIGTQIQSKKGNIRLKIKCIKDGKLRITLRGIDFRDDYDNRLPIYVKYARFMINDENIIDQPAFVWHNEPINHEMDVEDGQTVDVFVEWSAV